MFKDEIEFQNKIPAVLTGLGFVDEDAEFLGTRVNVEIARGAGHAMRPGIPEYNAWLRTNRLDDRLGWDGFDTAMHELGHNLEQLISTHFVPRPLLRNVPNTACTEAFAFLYQNKAKEVIGLPEDDEAKAFAFASVEGLLSACQIAGPSLVELYTWRWLYQNPEATDEQVRDQMLAIAEEVWNKYFKEYFGEDPYHILAAYQHMIGYPLYLPDYTIGHVISHQIKSHMRGKDLAEETKRICSIGRLTPDQWMKNAVGSGIKAKQLIDDAKDGMELI
jgi:oligoendopeptidase F